VISFGLGVTLSADLESASVCCHYPSSPQSHPTSQSLPRENEAASSPLELKKYEVFALDLDASRNYEPGAYPGRLNRTM
jgi:hypothetical protein